MHDVAREALFFAVLRERAQPAGALAVDPGRVDAEICEWLDEAEAEGAAILDRARSEAAAVRSEADASVRSLHDDVRRLRDRLLDVVAEANALLPALEAADRSLSGPPPVPELAAAAEPVTVVVPDLPRPRRLARLLRRG